MQVEIVSEAGIIEQFVTGADLTEFLEEEGLESLQDLEAEAIEATEPVVVVLWADGSVDGVISSDSEITIYALAFETNMGYSSAEWVVLSDGRKHVLLKGAVLDASYIDLDEKVGMPPGTLTAIRAQYNPDIILIHND